ncbi:hypothetical protein ANN_01092 [Periplaneta americana]|uniref:Uncharacterized protein n=1 Tax=Periplaneta americana TaxID=6978 RepID=A0ABQ8TV40_PERAM|nr:hypothetical protein ANN_01092 [Periplaneta americana]
MHTPPPVNDHGKEQCPPIDIRFAVGALFTISGARHCTKVVRSTQYSLHITSHPCLAVFTSLTAATAEVQCTELAQYPYNRHHKARTGIADVLKRRGWEVYEEIHCVSSLDSNRRADIVAIHRTQSKGLVLDPTIRFERDALQAQHVDEEKKSIYESCIPYLSEKYNIPTSQWSVSGVLFGARGTLPKFTLEEEEEEKEEEEEEKIMTIMLIFITMVVLVVVLKREKIMRKINQDDNAENNDDKDKRKGDDEKEVTIEEEY